MTIEGRPVVSNSACAVTRRQFALRTGAGLALFATADLFAASDFWNKKNPSAWTTQEILQLTTKSPWATTARVLPKPGRDRGSLDNTAPDLNVGAGGRSGNKRLGEVPVVPVAEVTVVW